MPQAQTQPNSTWQETETSTHQDHVIKHVIGATVMGWFVASEAAHLLLDMGFMWTIYLDGEMNLLPQGVAIAELEVDGVTAIDKAELAFDADQLLAEGRHAEGLKRFTAATHECLIESVEMLSLDTRRRLAVRGELSNITVETSLENGEVSVRSHQK